MKKSVFKCAVAMIMIAAASCQDDPQFGSGVDCGGCADPPPGGGTIGQFPTITSFTPTQGYAPFANTGLPGTFVTINGTNFSTVAGNNIVKFNGTYAGNVYTGTGSQLHARVGVGTTTGKISVTVSGLTGTSANDFIILPQNNWQQVADFGGVARYGAVSFVIKNLAYVGTGIGPTSGIRLKDFWQYDPGADSWTQKADFGGEARSHAASFATGSRGYIATGAGNASLLSDLWEYNPATNVWVQRASFQGEARYGATGFTVGSKGYIGTGAATSRLRDFWQYDPAIDAWSRKADFGGEHRALAGSFVISGKGYIGAGSNSNGPQRDFWEYDPINNSWTAKAALPSNSAPGLSGFFSIGSKGYAGGHQNQLWMFDPIANTWQQKANFPADMVEGVGFAAGNSGYIGLGATTSLRFYKYTPD